MNTTQVLTLRLEQELFVVQQEILDLLETHGGPEYLELKHVLLCSKSADWPEKMGNHMPEQIRRKKLRVELIQAALIQFELGLYGYCADCDAPIEAYLLESDPATQRCAGCQNHTGNKDDSKLFLD